MPAPRRPARRRKNHEESRVDGLPVALGMCPERPNPGFSGIVLWAAGAGRAASLAFMLHLASGRFLGMCERAIFLGPLPLVEFERHIRSKLESIGGATRHLRTHLHQIRA